MNELIQAASETAEAPLLPMREVVRLTGINPVTLRAWERRYGLIQPLRTEGGHRLYTQKDVETIRSILTWTERGLSVSKAAQLLERTASGHSQQAPEEDARAGEWSEWQARIREAMVTFDEPRLEQLYGQVFSTYPLTVVFDGILLPVWRETLHGGAFGQASRWLFLDAFLRARVLQRLQLAQRSGEQPLLLAALPEQCRELELLVTGLLLNGESGSTRLLPLGQSLDELPLVCQAVKPRGLVLYTTLPPDEALRRQLDRLVLALDCPLALCGEGAELGRDRLEGSPIACLGTPGPLMQYRLAQFLAGHLDT